MKKNIYRQIAVLLSFVLVVIVNALANSLPLNGINTGAVSDSFNVLFVPAGYVFSIWGLIYLLLTGYTVYHTLPAQRENPLLQRTGWLFALSNLLNAGWIIAWHYGTFDYWLTIVLMLGILASLITIYLRLQIGLRRYTLLEKALVSIPFSIYLGWISIATIANATDVIVLLRGNQIMVGDEYWTIGMLAVGVALALVMFVSRRDAFYLAVFAWAFAGIGQKWMAAGKYVPVQIAAFISAGLMTVLVILSIFWKKKLAK